jgi:hypothetical protein
MRNVKHSKDKPTTPLHLNMEWKIKRKKEYLLILKIPKVLRLKIPTR